MAWDTLASEKSIQKTIEALKVNGISALVVENGEEAKEKVLELIPKSAQVMTMSSVTLEKIGLTKELNESAKYDSVKKKLASLDRNTQGAEMRKLGAAPDYAIGSVHAVTENGEVIIASNSGSQLPAYVFGAGKVIWVVSTKKIVKNKEEGMKRIEDYSLPLESERAKKAYGMGSNISKVLIVNREFMKERITLILVKEDLGF